MPVECPKTLQELVKEPDPRINVPSNRVMTPAMSGGVLVERARRHRAVTDEPYDVDMMWQENSIVELSEEIADCLAKGDSSAATRLAFRFLERYDKSGWETRRRITADAPLTTGSDRYDALLAGIVEFACASHGVVAPLWVNDESFFLNRWWFVSGIASLHADALVHSPISLARRGVFVTQGALEYA
jgi:hypothetical protein